MISFVDEQYSWKNISLLEFLDEGNIPSGWKDFFSREDVKKQISIISSDLDEIRTRKIIYPPVYQVFRALYLVPVDKIKAVIIGQDCYHNGTTEYDGSAIGLCFSVKPGNIVNPSLKNIYKELLLEGFNPKENGDLIYLAKQGILLLNMALTVERGNPGSHSCMWYDFSILLVKYISEKNSNIHWLLFGKDSHEVMGHIKGNFHCTSHPSPLSAYKQCGNYPPFIGSGVFKNVPSIKW